MREIIFRGKRLDNGEWLEGYLFHDVDSGETEIQFMQYETDDCGVDCWRNGYEVDPETVGQFTGLTDKNGTKIFEGDIIKSDNGKQSAISVVKFGEYYPQMFYKMLDMCCPGRRHMLANGFYAESIDKHEEMILFQSPCVEIIGNIHDNPELLEG